MQGDVNSVYRRIRVATKEIQERIKGRSRVRIQQRVSQTRLADVTNGQVLPLRCGSSGSPFPSSTS